MDIKKFQLEHHSFYPIKVEFDESKSHSDIVFSDKNKIAKKVSNGS
jgi:hypothetical protein